MLEKGGGHVPLCSVQLLQTLHDIDCVRVRVLTVMQIRTRLPHRRRVIRSGKCF
jgi:hypothetical protein